MATAARHADRADALRALVEETRATKCSLVHCDVSLKNILAGAAVPVLSRCRMRLAGTPRARLLARLF